MRFLVTLGLLIAFCASAAAAPAHHPKRAHQRVLAPSSSQGVTAPARFAVPGWTDEQTQYWLNRATSCAGCG